VGLPNPPCDALCLPFPIKLSLQAAFTLLSVFGSDSFLGVEAYSLCRQLLFFSARREASFQDWWRESRIQVLRPRGQGEPSAKQRLEALKARLVARDSATNGRA
jgi:hypothetical protein